MTKTPRKAFASYGPYSLAEYENFRRTFIECASRFHREPAAIFKAKWPDIVAAANLCDQQLCRWNNLNDKTEWKHNPPDRELRRLRTLRANRFRTLRSAAKHSSIEIFLKKHPNELDALLYGGMKAGIVVDTKNTDYADEISQLHQLRGPKLERAIDAAIDGLIDNHSRPSKAPIETYALFLAELYCGTRNVKRPWVRYDYKTGLPSGPALSFFRTALSPFVDKPDSKTGKKQIMSDHGLRALIERVSVMLKKNG